MSDPREVSAAAATPRPSATLALLRDRDGLQVLMARRSASASFMPHAWVFPGGLVDAIDHGPEAADVLAGAPGDLLPAMGAALRELAEEVGVWLTNEPVAAASVKELRGAQVYQQARVAGGFDVSRVRLFAHWVTPTLMPVRFDTRFFAATAARVTGPVPDLHEIDRCQWTAPQAALDRATTGEWAMSPPTARTLRDLAAFSSASGFMAHAAALGPITPRRPRIRFGTQGSEVVAPGEPGFDDLEDLPSDPDFMQRIGQPAPFPRDLSDAG